MSQLSEADKVLLNLTDGITLDKLKHDFQLSKAEIYYIAQLRRTYRYSAIKKDWVKIDD